MGGITVVAEIMYRKNSVKKNFSGEFYGIIEIANNNTLPIKKNQMQKTAEF